MSESIHEIIEDIPVELCEPSDNAQVIYTTRHLAARIGFDDSQQSLIAVAASELSTNIIRYSGKGKVSLRIIRNEQNKGIEVVAQDEGPGISNIDEAMKDNFTTGGGLGLGLGSVQRIMDEFEIQSKPGHGTRIVVRKWR
ncbi:MAG: anti-sigma regulatory factor [Deltaproteobacteria bacterium]|nr:anti-sigma regulatory factor [Deltaproteobacteria bacterium]